MNKKEIMAEIKKASDGYSGAEGGDYIKLITAMQAHLASIGEEKMLEILCEIKMDLITGETR
jgi:hypothetical protein